MEAHFYQHLAPQLAAHAPTAAVPQALHIDAQPPDSFVFVLEDLTQRFPVSPGDMGVQEVSARLEAWRLDPADPLGCASSWMDGNAPWMHALDGCMYTL